MSRLSSLIQMRIRRFLLGLRRRLVALDGTLKCTVLCTSMFPVLSYLVLSCLWSGLGLVSCLGRSCLSLSCLALSCLVLSCLVLSGFVSFSNEECVRTSCLQVTLLNVLSVRSS